MKTQPKTAVTLTVIFVSLVAFFLVGSMVKPRVDDFFGIFTAISNAVTLVIKIVCLVGFCIVWMRFVMSKLPEKYIDRELFTFSWWLPTPKDASE